MQISKYIYVTETLIRFCYRRRIRIAFHNVRTLLDDGIEVLQKARFLQLARQLQWNTLAILGLSEGSGTLKIAPLPLTAQYHCALEGLMKIRVNPMSY